MSKRVPPRRLGQWCHLPAYLLWCVALCLALPALARAQTNWAPDPDFGPTLDAAVRAFAILPDGKVLIGGTFTEVDGVARNGIARLHADGTLDATFDPGTGANEDVRSLALQPDGKAVIGGVFTEVNGTARRRIARLHADGALDATFDPGTGTNALVQSVALQPDGKVLIAGTFTEVNGVARNRIARLNADGALDATFDPGAGAEGGNVLSIALQTDGKVLIAGGFSHVGGVLRNRIARLHANGSLDATFDPGVGANSALWSATLQPDGKVLISGQFTQVNDEPHGRIARLNADGSLDATFDPGTGASNFVYNVALQPDGRLLIVGLFTQVNGVARRHIARLHADGALDATFDPGVGPNEYVFNLALQPDDNVLIGGYFTEVSGQARTYVARLMPAPPIIAFAPQPVPVDAPWALALLAVLLGLARWQRSR